MAGLVFRSLRIRNIDGTDLREVYLVGGLEDTWTLHEDDIFSYLVAETLMGPGEDA